MNDKKFFKPIDEKEQIWIDWGVDHKNRSFFDYMKEHYNLTKEEFLEMMKEKYPEKLI